MKIEELESLTLAIEPLSAAAGELRGSEFDDYNDLVLRFRERVARGITDLECGRPHERELTQELFLMARELPRTRRRAEAAARRAPPLPGD